MALLEDGDVDDLIVLGNSPAFLLSRLETKFDRLADVGQSLLARASLADAARNQRTFGHQPTVFATAQDHRQIHPTPRIDHTSTRLVGPRSSRQSARSGTNSDVYCRSLLAWRSSARACASSSA